MRMTDDEESPTALDEHCAEYAKELDGIEYYFKDSEDREIVSLGINRLFQLVPASYCLVLDLPMSPINDHATANANATATVTKENIKNYLIANLKCK